MNPRAGTGAAGRRRPRIEDLAKARLGSFQIHLTNGPGDGTRLARLALLEGAEVIVCIGGDGTLNEVINGLMDEHGPVEPGVKVGFIPQGTGCDLIKTVPIPTEMKQAFEVILEGHPFPMDLGKLTCHDLRGRTICRYFHNVASFGLGGEVAERVNRTGKTFGGFLSFIRATLVSLLLYGKREIRLKVDEGSEQRIRSWNVAVANGQYHGGGMWIAPGARISDGLFHVTVVGDLSLPKVFLNLPRLYNGRILDIEKVLYLQGRRIEARSAERVPLEADGERLGQLPATIEVVPAALTFLAPAHLSADC